MQINLKASFIIFMIFLLLLCQEDQILAAEKKVSGKIKVINKQTITINDINYSFPKNPPLVIFKDKLGEKLIDNLFAIPAEAEFAEAILDAKGKIKKIIISGRENHQQINNDIIYPFPTSVEQYKLSPSLKYLAFFSPSQQTIKIIYLKTGDVVWQEKVSNPFFTWHPTLETLTIANLKSNYINIYNLDLKTLNKTLFIKDENPGYIGDLKWSFNGEYLAFTKISGFLDSHGYSQLYIFDMEKKPILKKPLPDVNHIAWSRDNKIAYSSFSHDLCNNFATNIVDPSEEKDCIFIADNTGEAVFWNNNLIYTTFDNFHQNIFLFELKNKSSRQIKKELRYIDSLAILNSKKLVYTFGDLPQIKILDLVDNSYIVLEGMLPQVIGNDLFYIKKNGDNFYLMKYKNNN